VVADRGIRIQPWVGVVDRALTGDCDCTDWSGDDDLCAHAVAVALVALDEDVKFAAQGRPHGEGPVEPERADYVEAVHSLGPRQLTDLVVEQALRDRLFATRLLGRAGMLAAFCFRTAAGGGTTPDLTPAIEARTSTDPYVNRPETAGQRLPLRKCSW